MSEHLVQTGRDINSIMEKLQYGDIVKVEPGEYGGVGLTKMGITFISIEPRGAKTGQWFFESGANENQIIEFEVTTGNRGGAFILNRANKNNLIKSCHMYECGSIGVDITGGSNLNKILDCLIHDCHYAFHTSGIGCEGNIFQRNHCYNHSDGVNISPSALGTKVLNNIIHNCSDDGIHCFDDGRAEVIGNLIYNCKGIAFWVSGAGGIISRNNTIIGMSGAKLNILVYIEKSGHIFKNNIAYVAGADMKLLNLEGSGDLDYNCWYNPQNPLNRLEYSDKIGLHSILKDPRFMDVAKNDYRLQPSSPCIGSGENGVNMGYWQNGGEKMWDVAGVKIVMVEEKGSISGVVVNEGDIPFAGVEVEASGPIVVKTQSVSDGTFILNDLPAGIYAVKGIKAGYKCDLQDIIIGA